MKQLKVLSIYDGFFVGGSRIIHTDIITGLHGPKYNQQHTVLSLTNRVTREYTTQYAHETITWKKLVDNNVQVHSLDRTTDDPYQTEHINAIQQLINQADIVITLKEQPLVALRPISISQPLIVSIHRSDPEHQGEGLEDLLQYTQQGTATIVSCAHSAKKSYSKIGIHPDVITVIENGIDLSKFKQDSHKRQQVRNELQVRDNDPVIMLAARFDDMKNIPLFIESAGKFMSICNKSVFLVCGTGMTRDNPAFQELLDKFIPTEHQHRVIAKGIVETSDYYPAADVLALTSSFGEAAPLCILESMANGVVPVVTDVGDSALMVKGMGIVTSDVPLEIAKSWAQAYHDREIYKNAMLVNRDSLSIERTIQSFAQVLENAVSVTR